MKTIARTATRQIAAVREAVIDVRRYQQSTGEMVASTVAAALSHLNEAGHARLLDYGDGNYTVHVHGELFYRMRTRPALAEYARTRLMTVLADIYDAASVKALDDDAAIAEAVSADLLPR